MKQEILKVALGAHIFSSVHQPISNTAHTATIVILCFRIIAHTWWLVAHSVAEQPLLWAGQALEEREQRLACTGSA